MAGALSQPTQTQGYPIYRQSRPLSFRNPLIESWLALIKRRVTESRAGGEMQDHWFSQV